jgi:heterodisulfide reductase subunit A-like polyferredoxin
VARIGIFVCHCGSNIARREIKAIPPQATFRVYDANENIRRPMLYTLA